MDKLQNRTIGRAARAGAGLVMAVLAATLTIFGATTPVAAQGLPLIRDTEIENLLNDYARPIFKAAGLGEGRVAVRIVRSDIFNAFVLDGRTYLSVTSLPYEYVVIASYQGGDSFRDLCYLRRWS